VLIAGGWNGHRADAADDPPWDPLFAELYEPAFHIFDVSSTMSTTRIGHVAVRLANGRVLMLGGVPTLQNIHEQPRDPQYAEIYDPVANSFSALAGLTLSQQGYTATLLANGKVLLVGGENLGTATRIAGLLDVARGTLDVTGELVTARMGHTATLLQDGRVLVTGGTDSNGNVVATAELYK
jgi:N-acetylneuraminic acid mutarotase